MTEEKSRDECKMCNSVLSDKVKPAQCIGDGHDGSPRCDAFDGICNNYGSCLVRVPGKIRACVLCDAVACSKHVDATKWWQCKGCENYELCEPCYAADCTKPKTSRCVKECVVQDEVECPGEFCPDCDDGKEDENGNPVCEYCEIPPTEEEWEEMAELNREYIMDYVREVEEELPARGV